MARNRSRKLARRGVAVTEAAILLPVLTLILLGLAMLGWNLSEMQQLHNGAWQGARAAMSKNNSNKEVRDAAIAALSDNIDASVVKVTIKKIRSDGVEDYQVQSLDANEQGELIKVTLEYVGGLFAKLLGKTPRQTSVVVRRPK